MGLFYSIVGEKGTNTELRIYRLESCNPFSGMAIDGFALGNRGENDRPTAIDYQHLEQFIAQNSVRKINMSGIESTKASQNDALSMANIVRRHPISSWEMEIFVSLDLQRREGVSNPHLLPAYYNRLGTKIAEIIRLNRSLCSLSIKLGDACGEVGVQYNLADHPAIKSILDRNKENSLRNFAYCFFHRPKQVAAATAAITVAATWPILLKQLPLYLTLSLPIAAYVLTYFVIKLILHCQRPAAIDFGDVLESTAADLGNIVEPIG